MTFYPYALRVNSRKFSKRPISKRPTKKPDCGIQLWRKPLFYQRMSETLFSPFLLFVFFFSHCSPIITLYSPGWAAAQWITFEFGGLFEWLCLFSSPSASTSPALPCRHADNSQSLTTHSTPINFKWLLTHYLQLVIAKLLCYI